MLAGLYQSAIEKGVAAAALYHTSGDAKGEVQALITVGRAYVNAGNYSRALTVFSNALRMAQTLHDGENEVSLLNNCGTVFYFQGQYSSALDRYQEAQRTLDANPRQPWTARYRQITQVNLAVLYQTLGQHQRALEIYAGLLNSSQALRPAEQAQLLANVGSLRRRLGDPIKALDTYRAAQELFKKSAQRDAEIAVLNNIGIVKATGLHDPKGAVDEFSRSLQLAEASGNRPLAVQARIYRGEAYYRLKDGDRSRKDFESAARDAKALGEAEEEWKALYGLGRAMLEEGKTDAARILLHRAIELIESLRAGLALTGLRSDFLADKREVYDLLIAHTSDVKEVFQLMERSRARGLQDRLHPVVSGGLDNAKQKLSEGSALAEYWVGSDSAALLWVSHSDSGLDRWNISKDDLTSLALLPSVLADPKRMDWRSVAAKSMGRFLDRLSRLEQSGIHRLLIIPDDAVARVPFEALPLQNSGLLLEHFAISYAPSASIALDIQPRRRRILWPWQPSFKAFADPSQGIGAGENALVQDRSWPRLPEAVHEVEGIARSLGGKAQVLTGAKARKEFLTASVSPPLLHFATHAFADQDDSERSYILLAPEDSARRFDYLFLREISELPLQNVDLATVSACETELGRQVPGEGVQNFSRAFLAAGAKSVVTSLWAVGDRMTAVLMLRFYSRLGSGDSKAEALRAAKLEFLKSNIAAHPFYWAAFILNGDGDSQVPYIVSWTQLLVAAIFLAATLIVVVRMRARRA